MGVDRTKIRWNGWGWAAHKDELGPREAVWKWLAGELGMPSLLATPARPLDELTLPPSKLHPDDYAGFASLVGADCVRTTPYERAFHALGRSYHDLLRLRAGDLATAPDAVLYPRSTQEVLAVLTYAKAHRIGLVPFGGGTSVVGGVTAARGCFDTIVSLDMSAMDRLVDLDTVSQTARVEAGIYGPALERALNDKGFTLGHLPQSFEFSTVGGWIAHRGAGQASNRYGRAEDWLVAVDLATTEGLLRTHNVPASAAGPCLKDIVAGSEGLFGIITEATIRVQRLPTQSVYRGYLFRDFASGSAAVRAAAQDGMQTTMLRLSDSDETRFFRAYAQVEWPNRFVHHLREAYLKLRGYSQAPCVLLAGFEGEDASASDRRFARIAARHGGLSIGKGVAKHWQQSRFSAPYLRDAMMDRGVGVDTLETAASWAKIDALYASARQALAAAIRNAAPREGARGIVMCHVSHSYRDGASLYFTYIFPRALEGDVAHWTAIKAAATQAIIDAGGTLSHHHGIGEDHRAWMGQEHGLLGIAVLKGIKKALDPDGILNPGKLIPD